MRRRVAIVYNEPLPSRYDNNSEQKAVIGVMEAVNAVHQALIKMENEAVSIPLAPPFEQARLKLVDLKVDVVFNLFEGFCGDPQSEALVPETLKELGIPFTGCQADVLRLALDKANVKRILKPAGVPTPDFQVLTPDNADIFNLRYPCMVKPRSEDASHGITAESVVHDFAALRKRVTTVCEAYGGSALVEEFIGGREFNATVMGNGRHTVLPVSEIVYSLPPGIPRILTFEAKWETGSPYFKGTKVTCPAEIDPQVREYIADTALKTYRLLGCSGYARVDMRMDDAGILNVMELNPNPDISPGTGAARQSAAAGMSYARFVDKIVNLALEKKENGPQNTPDVPRGQTGADADTARYARV